MTIRNTKKTLAALLATLTTIALAGCGTATTATQTEQDACTTLSTGSISPVIAQCDITLTDTRHVTCLLANWKGLTCDWAHASGTDKEPGK